MDSAKIKCNRTATCHARLNHAHLLGTLLICVFGSTSSGQRPTPDSQHDLRIQCLTTNQNTYDVVFKALLNALIEIFDLIDETQSPDSSIQSLSGTLTEIADEVLCGYIATGLNPNLTVSEIYNGILDCDEAITMLNDTSIELSLPQSTQNALLDTLELISGDLNASF